MNSDGWLRSIDGWLRSIAALFDGVATTNLSRDPDDLYDPADDLPFSWKDER